MILFLTCALAIMASINFNIFSMENPKLTSKLESSPITRDLRDDHANYQLWNSLQTMPSESIKNIIAITKDDEIKRGLTFIIKARKLDNPTVITFLDKKRKPTKILDTKNTKRKAKRKLDFENYIFDNSGKQ